MTNFKQRTTFKLNSFIMFYMVHCTFREVVASLGLFGVVVVQLAFDLSWFITYMVQVAGLSDEISNGILMW